ncbi:hypothetical protein OEA41_006306 [Lepraria neglecta]|uniref:Uncharacterized protein n=1 Tax=Lepraria neglecta TaxID=209136 RepID=A0AAE0DMX9_9LECA|nr:hypothetical protein OEA41_006306 [Lepraria neglecta]
MDETDDMGQYVTDLMAASKFSVNTLSQLTSIDGTQGGGGQVETANVSPVNKGPFLLFNTAAQNDADRSKKTRRADNTPDTTVQYINVVADESLAYDVLKFVDTQDAVTPLSLSAEGYLETTAGTISDLEIAGLKGSDDAIRLYPDDTETINDLATCAITAGVFSCEDQGTTGFYVCFVIIAIAADGGSGTTPSTTASGIFPTRTGSYPSGTGVYATGSGYFPSGTGSPSGSGYFPTRPAYPTGTGNPSSYPSGTGGFPSGSGYCPSGTGHPSGSGYFPPTNPSGTGFYPPSPTSGETGAPYHPQTTASDTGPRYPQTTSGGSNPQTTGGSGGGSSPYSGYNRVPSDILAIFPTGYAGYHWDKYGNIENSAVSIASAPTFLLTIGSLLAIFFLV